MFENLQREQLRGFVRGWKPLKICWELDHFSNSKLKKVSSKTFNWTIKLNIDAFQPEIHVLPTKSDKFSLKHLCKTANINHKMSNKNVENAICSSLQMQF